MANHANPQPVDSLIHQLIILREARGIKQARLAHMMGRTQTSVSEAERGHVDPKVSYLRAATRALGLNVFIGEMGMFPDLTGMSLRDLIDLHYLLGEELEKRISTAPNSPQESPEPSPPAASCCAAVRNATCDYC